MGSQFKLSPDDGKSDSRKYKQGANIGVYGEIRRSLLLAGI
jgi:hypothetical protein